MATNKPDIKITITADVAQTEAAISGLTQDLNKTAAAAKNVADGMQAMDGASKGLSGTGSAADKLAGDLDAVGDAAEGASAGIQKIRNTTQGLMDARAALSKLQYEFSQVKDAAIQSGKALENTVRDSYRRAMSTARVEVAKQRNLMQEDMAKNPLEIPVKVGDSSRISDEQRRQNYRNTQVSVQATDIVVSLASGQSPLTVLLQQGGQLKDVFGGVGNAFKALSGYFLALLTPINLTVAALGVMTVGFVKGQQEAIEFAKALALTNNAAGTSVDQLKNSADAIDNVAGTYANAADALTQLASSGVVGAGQLQELALAAIQLEKAGGPAMADTIKNFVELGKNPVEASRRLGDQMGYLNRATYDQIRALQQAGKEADAAALAQTAYKDAIDQSTAKIEASLGTLEKAAKATGGFFKEMWDAILGVGREDTLEQKVAKVEDRLAKMRQTLANANKDSVAYSTQQGNIGTAQAELQGLLDQIDARDQAAQKQADQVKANRKAMDDADRDFADRGERELAAAKARNDRMLAAIDAANAAVKDAYDDGLTNLEDYYKARGFLIDQQNKAELDQLKAQLAAAKAVAAKNPLDRGAQAAVTSAQGAITSAQISGASKVAQNLNESARAARDYADAIDKINLQLQENAGLETSAEAARLRRVTAEAQYRKQMGEATTPEQRASIQKTIDAQVAVGNLKAEQAKTERDLYAYTKQRGDIELQIQNGQISQIDGQRQLYDLEQQRNTEYLSMLQKMQQIPDLTEQQKNALQQAIDNAQRGLQQLSPLAQQFNTTLRSGLEDAFANALMRVTKLKDGLKVVAQQIAQMFAKRAAADIVSSFLPTFKFADGGYVRGPGTTTSDSIPALLSDREFVQPAHVVDHYGVDFMEAIRRLQIPKLPTTAVATSSQKLGRYAAGGLVGQPAASAASGAKIPVQVNIQNSGTGKTASSDASFDGKSVVVSVLLDDIKNNGPIFSGLNSAQRIRR